MLRTIFFLPPANRLFTFSRSALLSSPSTIRPSSATTETPFTSRFVNFSATLHPPQNQTPRRPAAQERSEEHTSELQSQSNLVCRLLLEKKKKIHDKHDQKQ